MDVEGSFSGCSCTVGGLSSDFRDTSVIVDLDDQAAVVEGDIMKMQLLEHVVRYFAQPQMI